MSDFLFGSGSVHPFYSGQPAALRMGTAGGLQAFGGATRVQGGVHAVGNVPNLTAPIMATGTPVAVMFVNGSLNLPLGLGSGGYLTPP